VAFPFSVVALSGSAQAQQLAAQNYVREKHAPRHQLGPLSIHRHERIRVGYFSADFHNHATSYLIAELLEEHDKTRFEVFGMSFGPDSKDDMRQRVAAACEHFIDLRDRTDNEVAALARELQIDIAVDLKGYTLDSRTGIFAQRAAPVQVNYLGYPGTMGAPYIDYLIADKILIPDGQRAHYTEKIVCLPDCYQPNDRRRRIAESMPSRAEHGLPNGFVFCCFNNSYKITPPVFDRWMHILTQIDGSVLWLLEDTPSVKFNLRRAAQARNVDPDRLVFAAWRTLPEHLARYRLADLFLDTLPYNAHTTASDALWAGVPVLTCTGSTFAGRVAASLLTAVGLPELIVTDPDQYETLAVALARDPQRLVALRTRLQTHRDRAALFDTPRYARHLEFAYERMVERARAGRPPAHIDVPRLPH
jgi:predicted O-linked N-acetylglucosamine transferase (SPINDLY family)